MRTPENSTSFAGTSRSRFEGLRCSALSAPVHGLNRMALPCRDLFQSCHATSGYAGARTVAAIFGSAREQLNETTWPSNFNRGRVLWRKNH